MLGGIRKQLGSLLSMPRPGTPPEGDSARATVVYYHGDEPVAGVKQDFYWRTVELRLTDDPQGAPTTTVETYLVRQAHQALRTGMDIPVRVKPGTRAIVGIDSEAFEAEVVAAAG